MLHIENGKDAELFHCTDYNYKSERCLFPCHKYIPTDFRIMNGKILEGLERDTHDTSS
jgi:hypothetical protein